MKSIFCFQKWWSDSQHVCADVRDCGQLSKLRQTALLPCKQWVQTVHWRLIPQYWWSGGRLVSHVGNWKQSSRAKTFLSLTTPPQVLTSTFRANISAQAAPNLPCKIEAITTGEPSQWSTHSASNFYPEIWENILTHLIYQMLSNIWECYLRWARPTWNSAWVGWAATPAPPTLNRTLITSGELES